jgi:ribosomal-protein-alanine N-acetyltransferase
MTVVPRFANVGDLAVGRRVCLRHPVVEDAAAFLEMVQESRDLHRPWAYPPSSRDAFLAYVDRAASEREWGCLVWHLRDHKIIGSATLSEIVRGLFQSAYLGFYGRAFYSGKGLMQEGISLLIRHAFQTLGLHRIEANVQPGNHASLAFVRSLGFRKEGYSPRYLKIGGRWRDHERWALLAEEWRARSRRHHSV